MKEEELLIQKAQRGESEAFGVLYDAYLPKIYRFIYLKVTSKADAEDITHHVFMNSWENIGSFRFQGFPFSSWLYRIAHNAVIDFYRTRKNTVDIESVIETEAADIPIDGDVLDTRYEAEKVHTALKTLKPDEQSVVIMKFINELSNAEVSVALEKSEGAIRVIQHRALKNLKKQLEQQTK
ncbi:hypothetical protein A3I34_01755 [Candidatus Jorgensenbacteria bacterium RIFCSPLOWO2_02_FULL_45_12]|uniref:RNA polymerase subunit sigma-24 n=2 Tax=Candidatus Joergenseniibacteriota TaxID=1752739 RepID=A0A1F6BNJ3_9BACT|nr:MAG: RNA polymerase, sigma-24 subunit, ECF subfamily [Candidatus Jorgensenbacteria bacterium GW2011_GWA2_45_9]OGG38489.1 MAG: hypothetical protein A3D55_02160 [Candidatus Jorgensenbacteria bacterium RIFCSPHIGHO2_02_FULL_45_20]OGG42321.1 MAG: hypothetical protein A3I34_01755 [Candidatus Jorgensenbacteria bacterium RIFCSPLOWO2_02_FULL_45_12]